MSLRAIGSSWICAVAALAALAGCPSSTPPPKQSSPPPPPPPPEPAPEPPPKALLSELEKRAVTDFFEAVNAHDPKRTAGVFAENVQTRDFGADGVEEKAGREVIESAFVSLFNSFPDIQVKPTRCFQRKDVVITEWISSFVPSGGKSKRAGIMGAYVFTFSEDGVIIRADWYRDPVTVAQQLGRVPGRFRPAPELPAGEPQWVVAGGGPEEESLVDVMKATWPESWTKHDRNAYAAAITDGAVHIEVASPNDYKGKAELLKEYDVYAKALPDMKVEIERAWPFAPNLVVAEFTFSGTMEGNIGPFKATKKPFVIHGLDIDELDAGKIAKAWTYSNGNELNAQVNPKARHGGKPKAAEAKPPEAKSPEAKPPPDDKPSEDLK